jgi:hypothetical protein
MIVQTNQIQCTECMHSMLLHCLACFISKLLPDQVSGPYRLDLGDSGGTPAELIRLHLAAAGFQGGAEEPLPPAV